MTDKTFKCLRCKNSCRNSLCDKCLSELNDKIKTKTITINKLSRKKKL